VSLPIPDLDNKSFAQLVEEARKLIPGYSTEWTDHNLSDPGITLIDLFAWLSEIAIYRTNLVTESHRLKYLKLLGVKPQSAKQARVDLTFNYDIEKILPEEKILPKGTRVWTKINDKKIYYYLEEEINIVPATLEKIVVNEGTPGIYDRSYSNLEEKGDLFFAPFGNEIQKGCALYLGFTFFENRVPDTLGLVCYLYEKDLMIIKNNDNEQAFKIENSGLKWEFRNKDETNKDNWNPVVPKDETQGFRKSGKIVFKNLEGWTASQTIPGLENLIHKRIEASYYWLRCVIEDSYYEYPPRIEVLRLNTVSAAHGMLVKDDNTEIVSNGLPGQVLELRETPIIDNTLKLSIENESWVEVDDFDGSGPSDKHFVLNKEKGEIKFGDGLMGLVPAQGSIIKVLEYMTGGGEAGNLMQELSWKIEQDFKGSIINYLASTGGKEAQTIDEAIEDLCRDLKTPDTAVTQQDFEQLAMSTPGLRVSRAKAIPEYKPKPDPDDKELEKSRGAVTIVIIPYTPLDFLKTPPEPSEDFKKTVCAHLDKHRILGTDIYVISPVYVKVIVYARVVPRSTFLDDGLIQQRIIEKLNRFLHPVKGGMDGKGWPIGRGIYLSDVYNLIESMACVNCVLRLSISGDRNAYTDADGNLLLKSRQASIFSGVHNIEIFREKGQCYNRGDGYSGK